MPQAPETSQGALDQFLQPQSMVTPGVLGAIAMVGTNAISGSFPYMSLPITALLLSGLFGLAAIVKSTSIPERALYYVLNSVIIFSVATGSNKVGQQIQQRNSVSLPSLAAYAAAPDFGIDRSAPSLDKVQFFKEWFPAAPSTPSNSAPQATSRPQPPPPITPTPDPQQHPPSPTPHPQIPGSTPTTPQ